MNIFDLHAPLVVSSNEALLSSRDLHVFRIATPPPPPHGREIKMRRHDYVHNLFVWQKRVQYKPNQNGLRGSITPNKIHQVSLHRLKSLSRIIIENFLNRPRAIRILAR